MAVQSVRTEIPQFCGLLTCSHSQLCRVALTRKKEEPGLGRTSGACGACGGTVRGVDGMWELIELNRAMLALSLFGFIFIIYDFHA